MINLIKLSQILSSRLCHEISSPVSGVISCYELIDSQNSKVKEEVKQLIKLGAEQLKGRIDFYRYAYGFIEETTDISAQEVYSLSAAIINSKLQLNLTSSGELLLKANFAKIIMCLIYSASASSIREGVIDFEVALNDDYFYSKITVSGKTIRLEDTKAKILTSDPLDTEISLSIYNVHEFYLRHLCDIDKYRILINHLDDKIEFILKHSSNID